MFRSETQVSLLSEQKELPSSLEEAQGKLLKELAKITQLPIYVRKKLDLSGLDQLDTKQLQTSLETTIDQENKCHQAQAVAVCLCITCLITPIIRGLISASFMLVKACTPSQCFYTTGEATQFGWQLSKWPAQIFGGLFGCIGGISYCCTKTDEQTQLIILQEAIDKAVLQLNSFKSENDLVKPRFQL